MVTENTADSPAPMKNKKSKAKKAWIWISGIVAALLVIVLVYGFVITRSGFWLVSTLMPDSQERKISFASASETTQAIADEGFVLLKNDNNVLPLQTSQDKKAGINVFGMRAVQLVYNAGGSSASNVDRAVRLEDALRGKNGNFNVNDDLLNLYYNYYKSGKVSISKTDAPGNSSASEFIEKPSNITVPEVPGAAYADKTLYTDGRTILEHAKDFSDTAMVVVGRGAGEMYDFAPSELDLSADESAMLDSVAKTFDKVILVVNSANPMELRALDKYPSVKSVLWIGYPGESGIESLARIVNGTVNPSGHVPDTWLKDNLASPAAKNYLQPGPDGTWNHESFKYTNTPKSTGYFTQYSEGIFVGYRYFETRHDTDPAFDYNKAVRYPFGHGLSYTTFDQQILSLDVSNGEVSVRVGVRNTGKVAGKDVVQVYSNPPYTGAIEKSTANLVAYSKTNLLEPGSTETYTVKFPLEDLASYDDKNRGAWVLEAGDYELSVRADSHKKLDAKTYRLDKETVYDGKQGGQRSSDQKAAVNRFADARGADDYLTRAWNPGNRSFTGPKESDFTAPQAVLDAIKGYTPSDKAGPFGDVGAPLVAFTQPSDAEQKLTDADMPKTGQTLDKAIAFEQMVGVPADDPKWDTFVSQLTVEEMAKIGGNGAWQIPGVERLGVPRTLTPDGSTTIGSSTYSGAIMGVSGKGVTYPIPSITAATWNTDIAKVMGTSVGTEAKAIGFTGWYAPAMNTHRTPFNGRNFEYYSEDGLLAGRTAAGVVRGATDKGIITFIKHFALDDRETNSRSFMFQWSSEQAIREVYLKPFELAVKEGGTLGAMSSFNFIGPTWAGGNRALLTDVLRNEWGFKGLVITDANMYPFMNVVQGVHAGGNLSLDVMSAWTPEKGHASLLKAAAEDPDTKIGMTRDLVRSTKEILFAVSNTWQATKK